MPKFNFIADFKKHFKIGQNCLSKRRNAGNNRFETRYIGGFK